MFPNYVTETPGYSRLRSDIADLGRISLAIGPDRKSAFERVNVVMAHALPKSGGGQVARR